jgi:Neuraminidase (sialidase)
MAKPIVLNFKGIEINFDVVKVDRSKIYGSRKRIAVDVNGNQCTRAALLADGSELISSGMTAQGYFTDSDRPVSRQEMVGLDDKGNVVQTKPSTLGIAQSLEGPVDPEEVLNLDLDGVYFLEALNEIGELGKHLKEGAVYKFPFNYSTSFDVGEAFLVANDDGYFALVGSTVESAWVDEAEVFVPDEVDTDDTDELDFDDM